MDFSTQVAAVSDWSRTDADALLIVLRAGAAPAGLGRACAAALGAVLEAGELELKPNKTCLLLSPRGLKVPRLLFAVAADASGRAVFKALQAAMNTLKAGGTRHLALGFHLGEDPGQSQAFALAGAATEAVYTYRHTKPSAPPAPPLAKVTLLCTADRQADLKEALRRASASAAGVDLAREWANRPGNHCTPSDLAAEARALARSHGMTVEVLERKDCEKLGMGCFLAVAQGSVQAPKFIVLRWQGASKKAAPVVLVGKGITFDTGGISLKPAAEMDEMKFDMGGAASVLGTMRAVSEMRARVNVVGLIPCAENMPSGQAVKPGDVVRSMSGQTVEILNTDAEGRLILCDALTYAERFKPSAVVDIATLTGACVIALGHHRSGLFSSDDGLAEELLRAGEESMDPCWRMPLDEEYGEALRSSFADMANVGPRAAGAVTAAMFLKRFAGKFPWAHLDIAGTAWRSGAAKGATGRPVPLLTQFLLGRQ